MSSKGLSARSSSSTKLKPDDNDEESKLRSTSKLKRFASYLFNTQHTAEASRKSPPAAAAKQQQQSVMRAEGANHLSTDRSARSRLSQARQKQQRSNGKQPSSSNSSSSTDATSGYNTSHHQLHQSLTLSTTTAAATATPPPPPLLSMSQFHSKPSAKRSHTHVPNLGATLKTSAAEGLAMSRQYPSSLSRRRSREPVAVQPPLVPMMIDDDDDGDEIDADIDLADDNLAAEEDCATHESRPSATNGFERGHNTLADDDTSVLKWHHSRQQQQQHQWLRRQRRRDHSNEAIDLLDNDSVDADESLSTSAASIAAAARFHQHQYHPDPNPDELHQPQHHRYHFHEGAAYLSSAVDAHTFVWQPQQTSQMLARLPPSHPPPPPKPLIRRSNHTNHFEHADSNNNNNQRQPIVSDDSQLQYYGRTSNSNNFATQLYYPTPFAAAAVVQQHPQNHLKSQYLSGNNHWPVNNSDDNNQQPQQVSDEELRSPHSRMVRQWPPADHSNGFRGGGGNSAPNYIEQPDRSVAKTGPEVVQVSDAAAVDQRQQQQHNKRPQKRPSSKRSMRQGQARPQLPVASEQSSTELSCCGKLAKLLLFTSNALFWCAGIALGAWGILALVDDHKYNLSQLLVFEHTSRMSLFQLLSWSFITLGCAAILVGFCGCSALFKNNRWILGLYIFLILTIFALDLATGLLAIIFQERLVANVRLRLVNKLQNEYGVQASFTAAVDYIQTHYECCGLDGHFDYDQSLWRLQRLGGFEATVARTCCHLRNTFDDQAHVNPRPVNESMCQSTDVRFHQSYRYRRGCLDDLERLIRHKIWTFTIGCGAVGVVILVSLMFATCFCRSIPSANKSKRKDSNNSNQHQQQQQQQQHQQRILTSNFTSNKKHHSSGAGLQPKQTISRHH